MSLFGRAVMTRLTERQALKGTAAEQRPKIIREFRRRPDLQIGPFRRGAQEPSGAEEPTS
jgi:hypothetical protein